MLHLFEIVSTEIQSFNLIPLANQVMISAGTDQIQIFDHINNQEKANFKHPAYIRHLALSSEDQKLLVSSDDNSGTIYDLGGTKISTLDRHHEPVTFGSFSPNGKWIVTCSRDNKAIVQDMDGQVVYTIQEHSGNVYQAIFSLDSRWIFTRSSDGTIGRTNTENWQESIFIGKKYYQEIAVLGDDKMLLLVTSDGKAEICSMNSANDKKTLNTTEKITGFKVFKDYFYTFSESKSLLKWNNLGVLLDTDTSHSAQVIGLDYDPTDQLLLTTTLDGKSWLRDRNNNLLMTIELENEKAIPSIYSKDRKHILGIQKGRLFICPRPDTALKQLAETPIDPALVEQVKAKFEVQSFN